MTDELYNKLSYDDKNQKWNAFLFACCFVVCLASFSFGYNIGVTNLPTGRVKDFYAQRYAAEYFVKEKLLQEGEMKYQGLLKIYKFPYQQWAKESDPQKKTRIEAGVRSATNNSTLKMELIPILVNETRDKLDEGRAKLAAGREQLENLNTILWTLTNVFFVIGGVIGAFTSKNVAEAFGRKKSIVFHHVFGVIAALLTVIAPYVNSPECVIIGRFLFGIQGGMTCGLIPGYLNEISPKQLRGSTGVMQQLFITIGIFISQLLGIRQLLGTAGAWHILLSLSAIPSILGALLLLFFFPDSPTSLINKDHDEDAAREALEKLRQSSNVTNEIDQIKAENRESKSDRSLSIRTAGAWHILLSLSAIPSILGALLLLFFFPDSPTSLINKDHDEDAAREALEKLRQSSNVTNEIDQIKAENRESKSDRSLSISELFTTPELKWPLITGVVLQLTQQLCGINAIFFYSESIFQTAKIQQEHIQYAVLATGIINVLATIIALPLIDRLGRKPLLVYPLLFIIVDYIALTFFLIFKNSSIVLSYLSIVSIVLFIVSFAVGLGPIPFVYVAECFRAEARSTALAVAMFSNWFANLVLTLVFPYMAKYLGDYTFLVFVAIVSVAVTVIIKKVPETKGKSVEEIMAHFDPSAAHRLEESSGKLMSNTNV